MRTLIRCLTAIIVTYIVIAGLVTIANAEWIYQGPPKREAEFRNYEMALPACIRAAADRKFTKLIVPQNSFFKHYAGGHSEGVTFGSDGCTIIDGNETKPRLFHVFLHEMGHQVDHAWGSPSNDVLFHAAVDADFRIMPLDIKVRNNYASSSAEAWAEMFASLNADDYGESPKDFDYQYFRLTRQYIRSVEEQHCGPQPELEEAQAAMTPTATPTATELPCRVKTPRQFWYQCEQIEKSHEH